MPTVETTVFIHAPVEMVYDIAKDNKSFPLYMDDVKSLTVVEDEGDRIVSEWVGVISAFNVKVRWTQEDIWDPIGKTCSFKQVKGDYDSMDGTWSFTEERDGCRFNSVLHYEYTVPGLGALVRKVVHGLVIKNMEAVLGAIKKRAEDKNRNG